MFTQIPLIDLDRFLNGREEDRQKVALEIGDACRNGYTPIKEEKSSPKGDLKEGFDLAMELSPQDKDRIERGASLYGPNFWPENLQGFRQCIYDEYYLRIFSLGHKLFEAFALSLNLP